MTPDGGSLFAPTRGLARALVLGAALGAGLALLLRLVGQRYRVEGASMFPTLRSGDRLLVERFTPRLRGPCRGELLLLADPECKARLVVKRLVGLPGERMELVGGSLLVGGVELDEPYRDPLDLWYGSARFELRNDEVFLLGDNRSASRDSRHFGPVPRRRILGRAWYRYFPRERAGRLSKRLKRNA